MSGILQHIAEVYNAATMLEREGRENSNNPELIARAAIRFNEAAELSEAASKHADLHPLEQLQATVYTSYYRFCAEKSHAWYYYRLREIHAAVTASNRAEELITEAITAARDCLTKLPQESRPNMQAHLLSWECEQLSRSGLHYAILARDAWDADRVIDALDAYRRAADRMKEALEFIKSHGLATANERVTAGNYIAMLANQTQVFARITLARGESNGAIAIRHQDFLKLMKYTIDAYTVGVAAAHANPEWTEYGTMVEACHNNLRVLLQGNPDAWLGVYCEFEGEDIVLNTMKEIDLNRFKEVEAARHLRENKALKLWYMGSFWLVALVVVTALVLTVIKLLPWYLCVLGVGSIIGIMLVIGALILRTIGDLTEKGFLSLMGMALRYQLKVFDKARSNNDDDGPHKPIAQKDNSSE